MQPFKVASLVVLNNSTLSIFKSESYASIVQTIMLPDLEFSKDDETECIKVSDTKTK
jgi:hypothetical protein